MRVVVAAPSSEGGADGVEIGMILEDPETQMLSEATNLEG